MMKLYKKLSSTALALLFCSSLLLAQDRTVSGAVLDEGGQPLPGVNVLVKGTSNGSVTDAEGNFSLSGVNDNTILVFSFIGYLSQEVAVGAQTNINVTMQPDITQLGEVVVVGYGEQKKSLLTGAISSVKADEIATVSVTRIDQALQGRTPGVNISTNSGSPGAGTRIRIRGTSSNGRSEPLYIIDGVRTSADGMDFLAPSDVASMEVLKDAASAAIYGAEGANGVIIITTKKGRPNSSEITYSGQYGIQSVRKDFMQMMNAQQYQTYLEEANVLPRPAAGDVTSNPNGTDWFDALFKDAPQQQHTLSFTGGTDKSTYFISGNLMNQEGIVGGDKALFKRYNLRINTSHKLKDWLTVGENFSYSNSVRRGIAEDNEFGSIVGSALAFDPTTPVTYAGIDPANYPQHLKDAITANHPLVKDGRGNYYGISPYVKGEFGNPIARIQEANGNTIQNKILGNIFMEFKPVQGLKFTTRLGLDAAWQRNHNWNGTQWYSSESNVTVANASDSWDEWYTLQWENFAEYSKSFGDHNMTLLGGGSMQKYTHNNVGGSYAGLFREEEKWSYGSSVPDDTDRISSSLETVTLASYFGRLNYDFKGKYLFSATVRRDGSSMLADGNNWGTFPSVSAGWVISEEDFFTSLNSPVSFAKLRASWGQNGSLSNLSPGQWKSVIATNVGGVIRYPNAIGTYEPGAAPNALPNPELKWETSEQLDIGLELRFFDDRLSFTTDYFKKVTRDLITPGTPPGFAGAPIPFVNGGEVTNKGFEFELSYRDNGTSDFKYEVSANLTTIDNEVTSLVDGLSQINGVGVGTSWGNATLFKVGYPIWFFNGYATDGIFQSQEEVDAYTAVITGDGYAPKPGFPIIRDINGDNNITEADMQMIGNPHPDFYYGARVSLGYKGFDFLVFLQGQSGNDILMGFNRTDRPTANKPLFFYEDRWTPENGTNSWFASEAADGKVYSSDYMIFNGSYARVRQLQLGYTVPSSVSERINLRNVRAYVSLDNYITFTKYPGLDPEAGTGNDRGQGIDRGVYPMPRRALFGLTFTF